MSGILVVAGVAIAGLAVLAVYWARARDERDQWDRGLRGWETRLFDPRRDGVTATAPPEDASPTGGLDSWDF